MKVSLSSVRCFVTQEDLKNHANATLRGMAEGAAAALALALPGSFYLHRRWAYYRSLPITIKALGVVLLVGPAVALQAERKGVQYDKEHNWSGAGKEELDREANEEERRWVGLSTTQKATDWALRHRWHLFVVGWVASMGGSWLILRRNKTQTFSQKIVQARVYAQGLALTGLLGSAALSQMQPPEARREDPSNHSWARLIEQQAQDAKEHEAALHA
ncbi:hypothetical protein EW145_g34 [Phellinidium pouzarii]|uniref:HIG1 domain-containing protein n=1 Tax=Phellinidium pouzarii TaxID=167371 RepID=A0A4S4LKI3_9AGAM|nr:hypothetical protein EW145_g34 [Phellinidium pouzarii]